MVGNFIIANHFEPWNLKDELVCAELHTKISNDPYSDPNRNYNLLEEYISKAKNKHIPNKYVKFNKYRHKNNKWITYGIIHSIKARDKMYLQLKKLSVQSPQHSILKQNISTYNKILRKTIREAKVHYYEGIFKKYKNDIKKTWKTIRGILNLTARKKNKLEEILLNGKSVKEPEQIANELNNFFANIGPNLSSKIDTTNKKDYTKYLNKKIFTTLNFELVDEKEVSKIIKSLKTKNYGASGVPFSTEIKISFPQGVFYFPEVIFISPR